MKKVALIIPVVLLAFYVKAQDVQDPQNMKVKTTREAQYPGGEETLYQDIYRNLKYSEEAVKQKVETTVMVSFFVEGDSTISSVNVINDPGYGCGESLKKYLIQKKFEPALLNGTPYRSQLMLNVPLRAH